MISDLTARKQAARRELREIAKLEKAARPARPRNQGVKLAGEPGAGMPRKAMGVGRRGRIIVRQCHRCARCNERVSVFEIDHVLALELGGADDDDNLQALCGPCHRAKTGADIQRIAKAKRQSKLLAPKAPSKRPIRSRGFG